MAWAATLRTSGSWSWSAAISGSTTRTPPRADKARTAARRTPGSSSRMRAASGSTAIGSPSGPSASAAAILISRVLVGQGLDQALDISLGLQLGDVGGTKERHRGLHPSGSGRATLRESSYVRNSRCNGEASTDWGTFARAQLGHKACLVSSAHRIRPNRTGPSPTAAACRCCNALDSRYRIALYDAFQPESSRVCAPFEGRRQTGGLTRDACRCTPQRSCSHDDCHARPTLLEPPPTAGGGSSSSLPQPC